MSFRIEIPLSRERFIFGFIVCCLFEILGWIGAINPEYLVSTIFRDSEYIRIFGVLCVCLNVTLLVYLIFKLFDKKPGLIIDENGITDNTNATSLGLIEWKDITGIGYTQVVSTWFIILIIDNTSKYEQRHKNCISKLAIIINTIFYGSPIVLSPDAIKIKFEELRIILDREFNNHKNN